MKGQKLATVFILLIVTVLLLAGCSQDAVRKGKINTAYFLAEDMLLPRNLDDYTAPREARVTVNGITYTGTYLRTTQPDKNRFCSSHVYHTYEGDGFRFRISAFDGEFDELSLDRTDVEKCTFNAEQCREAADAIADDYISLDEYQVTENSGDSNLGHTYHSFTFFREISGIRTADSLVIGFNCNGDLCEVDLNQIGTFKNVKSIDFDENKVKKAIKKRLKKDSARVGLELSRFEIVSGWRVVKTEADQCALVVAIVPYYMGKHGEEGDGKSTSILVIVDYEKYD